MTVALVLGAVLLFQLALFGYAGGKLWEMTGGRFRNGVIFGAIGGPGWIMVAWMIRQRRIDEQATAKR